MGRIRQPGKQTMVIVGAMTLAFCALALAVIYSGDQSAGPAVNSSASGGGATGEGLGLTPIEGWFPQAGEAGACLEKVGVDLISGFAATLVVNGVTIESADMNTTVQSDNESTSATVITADGALGRYTWGPEEDCPNGEILRTGSNQVVACVYEIGDNPANCLPYGYTFKVL